MPQGPVARERCSRKVPQPSRQAGSARGECRDPGAKRKGARGKFRNPRATAAEASGWTWATIAQKNPKALALDPEPSAPGVEPVVVPQRVVSLDKEAKKAGGLCVALAGVIVKPTDEVDVTKTYQLVAFGE